VPEGTLIAESLRPGTTLDGLALTVRKIIRHRPGGTTKDQPAVWTNIDFEVSEAEAGRNREPTAASTASPNLSWTGRSEFCYRAITRPLRWPGEQEEPPPYRHVRQPRRRDGRRAG
jgi:hypothetical protein